MNSFKNKFRVLSWVIALVFSLPAFAQTTQTLRGRVVDEVSKTPLIGVNVVVLNVTNDGQTLGSTTDVDGYFKITNVPLGRQTIKISYVGYDDQVLPNTIVTAGKEVVLNLELTENVTELNEVVVVAGSRDDKTATVNDLATVSARSFDINETKRYAGALGDPSRMVANFAGVVGGNDSRNDIVVRGNSPLGVLWQIEGMNVPNPNHFGATTATGGPVSMLNNNNIDKSDFITSAFPAQYGNAVASAFDIRLRDGNNEKREYVGQIGFNGFEFGAEGPFKQGGKGSYIVNYRYSTLGLFNAIGLSFAGESNIPLYQDLNFKISLPTKGNGKWTAFGLLGRSSIDLLGSDISQADLESNNSDLFGDENTDAYPRYQNYITGLSFEKSISPKTFIKVTGGYSYNQNDYRLDSLVREAPTSETIAGRFLRARGDFSNSTASLVFYTRTKFNSKNSLTSGLYLDRTSIDYINQDFFPNVGKDTTRVNVQDDYTLMQAHSTWRHRFNNQWSFNAGIQAQYFDLNEQFAVAPRFSLQYQIDGTKSLSAGFGVHNQTQNTYTLYSQTKLSDGSYRLTNTDLDFTRSLHYVLTYDWNITEFTRIKAEGYYQSLSNIPVERESSSFSAVNTGASFAPEDYPNLVNEGTGTNVGVELTLERFFNRGFYYLLTTSIFDSQYKGSDGVERNTTFNTGYVVNLLAGKEWEMRRKGRYFTVNFRLSTIGGRYLTPIDFQKSEQAGRAIFRESEAYSERQDPYFRADLRFSYRRDYRRSSLEIALDLQNVSGNQNVFQQTYNPRTNSIVTEYQQGFFPVPYIRYTF